MRPIDGDELKLKLPNTYHNGFENCRECRLLEREEVNAYIDRMPTIDAAPVMHGKWEYIPNDGKFRAILICSKCKKSVGEYDRYKFCPHCGAKMDLEEMP